MMIYNDHKIEVLIKHTKEVQLMLKEKFFETLGDYDHVTATLYVGDEIPMIFKMPIVSVENYDEEVCIRGEGGTFLILSGDPTVDEEGEYLFDQGNYQVGIACS